MRPEDIPVVRNLPLFSDMDDRRFEELVEAALLQTFPPQVDLIREGDPADFLYVRVTPATMAARRRWRLSSRHPHSSLPRS